MTLPITIFLASLALMTGATYTYTSTTQQAPAPVLAPVPIAEELWAAARAGDTARVTAALDKGADVNVKTRYGATALTFAADKGHIEVVKLLIARGADVNVQDTFYQMRAIDMAMMNNHPGVVTLLLERGSKGAPGVLAQAIQRGNVALVAAALESPELTRAQLRPALAGAKKVNNPEILALVEKKLAAMPAEPAAAAVNVDRATLQSYVGSYRNEEAGAAITVALNGDQLVATPPGGSAPALTLVATSPTNFRVAEREGLTINFEGRGGMIERAVALLGNNPPQVWTRVATPPAGTPGAPAPTTPAAPPTPAAAPPTAADTKPAARTAARNWPGFRGENAAGNGDGQGAVVEWDVDTQQNIRWKTAIPGISNASPVVWGNRVFVVSAISSAGDKTFRTGLYGDVAPVNDLSEHTWKIYCLDKATGKILWERDAFKGVPKVKRHTKASQANSTPATDGRRVVAMFGSIGILAAWDMGGKPLWQTNVGVLDSGWFFDPDTQWGHSSSPIIHGDNVIVQADRYKDSFIAAYHAATGKERWRTERDEISSWGTPTVFRAGNREQIVTNGPKIRGYDPSNGKLLWTLGPNSEVTVGTPVVGNGVVYVTGGYPPARPVYAIKPNASGDIALPKDQTTHEAIAWSNSEGTYIPTPIFYDGILYTCGNNGVVTAYDGATGERIYRARVGGGGSFSASPIAADGRLYFANEDGDIFVARAGRTYQEIAKNEMKGVIMSTPAISDGVLIVRTLDQVYGIGQK
jgi:outer membrane protein assembly factor BamB